MFDFFQNNRWIIYGIIGVLILVILGVLAYNYLNPGQPQASENEEEPVGGGIATSTNNGGNNGTGSGGQSTTTPPISGTEEEQTLLQLTDFSTIAPVLNKTEDKIIYYKKEAGHIFSTKIKDGAKEEIINTTILGIIDATWSPAKDRAAVFYLDQDQETLKALLEIGSSTTLALPTNIKGFTWAPGGKSAAYLLQKDKRLYLTTIDPAGKKPRTIYRTSIPDAQINWIGPVSISFQSAPSGTTPGNLFTFSTTYKTLKKVVGPLSGLMGKWSPDIKSVLISFTDQAGRKPALSIYNNKGKELFKTGLQTLADKCVFTADSKFIYCAVPRNISATAVFPDEYLRGEINTSDRIIRIDIARKIISDVFDQGNFDMADLGITKKQDYLFFINRGNGTLWRVKLK